MRVYVAAGATDMRRSFDALSGMVEGALGLDPLSGHVFAFCNRRRTLIKLLVWDGSGFWVHAKRLEKGTFAWPSGTTEDRCVELTADELHWLLGGLDPARAQRRLWWRRDPRRA